MGLAALALFGCSDTATERQQQTYFLEGAWLLQLVEYPTGEQMDYSIEGSGTFCHLYGPDSTLYECRMSTTPSGMVIMPTLRCAVTLVDKGGELLYLEADNPRPLTIVNDTSITMTPSGVAQIGLMASGDVVLKVTTPGGTAEQACRFSYE